MKSTVSLSSQVFESDLQPAAFESDASDADAEPTFESDDTLEKGFKWEFFFMLSAPARGG